MLWAAARDYDRIGHKVAIALDQVASDRWQAVDRPAVGRDVARLRLAGAKVRQETGEGLLAGADEDRVGMGSRFIGK